MMEELNKASELLAAALERYHNACSALLNHSDKTPSALRSQSLLKCVSNQLSSISTFETSIQRTKTTVIRTRNLIPAFVPANLLPDEIWGEIFCLLRDLNPCYLPEKTRRDVEVAKSWYPELLTHVCSHWRRIAIDQPSLWTHIDLLPNHPQGGQLYSRGKAFASQSRYSLLSLHIHDYYDPESLEPDLYAHLSAFCAPLSARIHSLQVTWLHQDCQLLILRSCLAVCEPGILRKVLLSDDCGTYIDVPIDGPAFVTNGLDPTDWCLDLSKDFIERLMAPVHTLSLRGLYFHWASKAYAGLTELRLSPLGIGDASLYISSYELVQVFTSSPQLRVLHFGIMINDAEPPSQLVPVQLKDLEILDLRFAVHETYPEFFPLISPIKKPLQLSLGFDSDTESPLSNPETKIFFQRSNITQLYMDGPFGGVWLPDLLELLPHIQALVLSNVIFVDDSRTLNTALSYQPHYLDTLRLLHCIISIPVLKKINKLHPINNLILWNCTYQNQGRTVTVQKKDREAYFAGTASEVRFIDTPPPDWNLVIEDWDPWE